MSAQFEEFLSILAKLRAPDGCPWDRKQTHQSLKPYFIEETYEALQAIDDGNDYELASELGDVLLQIGLHSQIASEDGRFSFETVLEKINQKMIRRHPHVFGDTSVDGVEQVVANWEAIKATEKDGDAPESVLAGVPESLPALLMALKVSKLAAKVGFEWPDIDAVMDKLREEAKELQEEIAVDDASKPDRIAEEIGDLLFTVVNIARWAKVDPEEALRKMIRRFTIRFHDMESHLRADGREMPSLSAGDWNTYWEAAKLAERVDQEPKQG